MADAYLDTEMPERKSLEWHLPPESLAEIRLACMEWAHDRTEAHADPDGVTAVAKVFSDYVLGAGPAACRDNVVPMNMGVDLSRPGKLDATMFRFSGGVCTVEGNTLDVSSDRYGGVTLAVEKDGGVFEVAVATNGDQVFSFRIPCPAAVAIAEFFASLTRTEETPDGGGDKCA